MSERSRAKPTPDRPCEVYEYTYRVPYVHCDPMGYFHHSAYIPLFEMGRTELLRSRGVRYRDVEEQGLYFVVYRVECTYRRPARYDDVLTVRSWIERVTRARIDHAYEILIEGRTICNAKTTLACVGDDGQPVPIPPWILEPE